MSSSFVLDDLAEECEGLLGESMSFCVLARLILTFALGADSLCSAGRSISLFSDPCCPGPVRALGLCPLACSAACLTGGVFLFGPLPCFDRLC